MTRYSRLKVGDNAELQHTVTAADIEKFVELSGDDNRLHVDDEFASTTPFKTPVAHGMIGAAFISTIIGTKLPGDGALWYSQNLEFLLPVRVGDKLTIKAVILRKLERQHGIELQTDIFNQHKQKVTTGIAQVKIIEADQEVKDTVNPTDKIALIVGATGGIGSATSKKLAENDYNVILHYNSNKAKALQLKEELSRLTNRKIVIAGGDIRNHNTVIDMMSQIKRHFPTITAFVNASALKFGNIKFKTLEWEDIATQIDINIKASFLLMKEIVPLMEANKYGKVVFVTSQATEQFNSEWLHYVTAKSALNGYTKALALELAPLGIRINLVSPGMTDTELVADIPEKARLLTAARTPLKRLASPVDIANAISYLLSEESDFITGETVRVNGGQVML